MRPNTSVSLARATAGLMCVGGVWNLSPSAKCLEVHKIAYLAGGISVVLDIIILILPIPYCARLQMGWKRKIIVMFSEYIFKLISVIS